MGPRRDSVGRVPDVTPPLTIPRRFCGPATSGNGGWTAGALAAYLAPGPVRVTLRKPPPLDTDLAVALDGDSATATDGDIVVAAAMPADESVTAVEAITAGQARAAESTFAGLDFHPFPTCFSCGLRGSRPRRLHLDPGPQPRRQHRDAGGHLGGARLRRWLGRRPHPAADGARLDDRRDP